MKQEALIIYRKTQDDKKEKHIKKLIQYQDLPDFTLIENVLRNLILTYGETKVKHVCKKRLNLTQSRKRAA